MSKVFCHRCDTVFEDYKALSFHWKKNIPCDFVCMNCGMRLSSRTIYYDHMKSNCTHTPKYNVDKIKHLNVYTDSTQLRQYTPTTITSTDDSSKNQYNAKQQVNGHVNTVSDSSNVNIINIDRVVITPHTQEMKIDKKELLGDIMEKILFRMDIGKSGKANWGTMAFTDSFHQMFEHIYANKDKPHQQNLFLKNAETRELQIFDGEKFVDDKLSSEERMLKVLHFIGDGLKWMVENSDNYSEEFKKEKTAQIGRVLGGIPRFKITYRQMFDNMFNSLTNVREQILCRVPEGMEMIEIMK